MKSVRTILTILLPGLLFLSSCKKSDTADQITESKFTWVYGGVTFTAQEHAARTTGIGAPSIRATLQPNVVSGTGPRINLTGLQQGTYAFTTGSGNYFDYIDDMGDVHMATAGTLNITKNASSLISGNFSVTLTNSRTLTGEFVNTPIKP